MASFVQWLVAMYSTYSVDNAMVGCFLHFHKTTSMPTKNTYPMVDLRSFAAPAQSALQNPYIALSSPPRYNLKSNMPFKYLMIPIPMWWTNPLYELAHHTTANARSAFASTIAYMNDSTDTLYEMRSISPCILLNSTSRSFNIKSLGSHWMEF